MAAKKSRVEKRRCDKYLSVVDFPSLTTNFSSHLFHSMLPVSICVSFNKAPTIEDFPLPLLPTITVRTPVKRDGKFSINSIKMKCHLCIAQRAGWTIPFGIERWSICRIFVSSLPPHESRASRIQTMTSSGTLNGGDAFIVFAPSAMLCLSTAVVDLNRFLSKRELVLNWLCFLDLILLCLFRKITASSSSWISLRQSTVMAWIKNNWSNNYFSSLKNCFARPGESRRRKKSKQFYKASNT